MRDSIRWFLWLVFVACLIVGCSAADKSGPPNIVLVIGDDISSDDFGCYGHPSIRTPNVDSLAGRGLKFTNAYLTTSQCSPTRCSVISGRYPHNTGAPELHMPLPDDQPMFPLLLKKAGYYTAAAGKWHLGDNAMRAFDRIEGGNPGGEEFWLDCLRERPRGKPFFMWFASKDAHRPWDPQTPDQPHAAADAIIPPYMADAEGTRLDLATYYDEVARLDRYVRLVVEELRRQQVYDKTLICVMADNGRPFPRCKTWLYDAGIKTPLVMSWPGGIRHHGVVSDSLVSVIDLAPTFLELAGVTVPAAMQGVSLTGLFENPDGAVREHAFAEHNWHDMEAHERMVRWRQYKYIRNARPELSNWVHAHHAQPPYVDLFALRKAGSLTRAQAEVLRAPRPEEMLFDVEQDPQELVNLAGQPEHESTLERLRSALDQWREATGDTVPANLTGDIIDRETFAWRHKPGKEVPRGTIPGSERNAERIGDPGPR